MRLTVVTVVTVMMLFPASVLAQEAPSPSSSSEVAAGSERAPGPAVHEHRPAAEHGESFKAPTWGVLFNLQNIFQNAGVLSEFNGGAGLQYNINPMATLRLTAAVSHTSNPPVITETTTTTTVGSSTTTTTTKTMTHPDPTSSFGLTVGVDYLGKLTETDLAPYLGFGLSLGLATAATSYNDTTVADVTNKVNDAETSFGVGVRGILGVSWRVHQNFLLFAEYALNVTIVNATSTSINREITGDGGEGGDALVITKGSSSDLRVFDFSTALSHGPALGLVVLF